ncbi:MAG: hypothetical protein QMC97_00075 [Pseudothermotoga sp.]|uniref:hypothetical protein n=1 Tax=Pseudothermotoga sp. TaxID=2033661 RepID=UPI002589C99B|nr:hypothetical protein [Pseudothermotoga sp.]MDI6861763.1 hypothetical protein [Pseudothermotoga sp.]
MKKFLLVLSFFLIVSVLAQSLEDLEKSWLELLQRVVREPDSDELVELGRKLSAKRRLAQLETLKDSVLEENLDKFVANLSEMSETRDDLLDECFVLFPKLKADVASFERGDNSKLNSVCALWKLGYKPVVPQGFAAWLVQTFLSDPFLIDWNLVFFLKNSSNKDVIAKQIRQECEKLKDKEKDYPALYRLMVLAKQLDGADSQLESELSRYIELMTSLERYSSERLSNEEFEKFSRALNNLNLKKDNLKAILSHLAERSGIQDAVMRELGNDRSNLQRVVARWKFRVDLMILVVSAFFVTLFLLPRKLKISFFAFFKAYRIAIWLCQKELSKDPTDIRLRTQLAMFYERIGENEKAFQQYKIVRDLSRMVKKDRILPRA